MEDEETWGDIMDAHKHDAHKHDPNSIAALLSLVICEDVLRAMKKQGITRTELARRMGISNGSITKLFDVRQPMTLRTAARLVHAVGCRLSVGVIEVEIGER